MSIFPQFMHLASVGLEVDGMSQLGNPTDLVPVLLVVVACELPEATGHVYSASLLRKLKFGKQRYHLRRSNFLQTFNASPDETAYYRMLGTWLVCSFLGRSKVQKQGEI